MNAKNSKRIKFQRELSPSYMSRAYWLLFSLAASATFKQEKVED